MWLRGPDLTDEIDAALRRVPGLERFRLLPGDLLAAPGADVPSDRLPSLAWKPIADQFAPAFPRSSSAGDRPESVPFRVVASSEERAAAALLTDVDEWERWCADAAEVRLMRLRFAACADGRVLVVGSPLPPIPHARTLWDDANALVPCGFVPQPDIGGDALRRVLGLAEGDFALLSSDGAFEVIPGAVFAAASRSAARLTRSSVAGD